MTFSRPEEFLAAYPDPTFEELLRLCMDYGLITDYEARIYGVRVRCVTEAFEVSVDEAEVLMKGLLLGYFYGHSRDDLTPARWHS